jgi:hypothetical protein
MCQASLSESGAESDQGQADRTGFFRPNETSSKFSLLDSRASHLEPTGKFAVLRLDKLSFLWFDCP